jgi:hypothetical protein
MTQSKRDHFRNYQMLWATYILVNIQMTQSKRHQFRKNQMLGDCCTTYILSKYSDDRVRKARDIIQMKIEIYE